MQRIVSFPLILAIIGLFGCGFIPPAHGSGGEDRSESPYFQVISDSPTIDRLPLKSTFAEVNIAGVIADVKVTQLYRNEGKRPLEAVYVFPASTKAAVHGMKMTVGERTVVARIRTKEEARQEYEQAREQGKNASLLEQERPNVFKMSVANIMPGDDVRVELEYTELLVPEQGVYEFIYPTVVGPRYTGGTAAEWNRNPHLHQGEDPPYTFDLTANVAAGFPIQAVSSPTHKVDVEFASNNRARVTLPATETNGGNRDFIMKYRLAGDQIQSGLLLHRGEKENFFLLMVEPPRQVTADQIPPREYIFIVDVSGSMNGFPLDISKRLMRSLLGTLRPVDRFNILLFAGGSTLMADKSVAATPQNIAKAVQTIDRQSGGGGTELLPALKRALALPKSEGFSRSVIIATDGYVTVEKEAFDLIRANLGNANFFPFGIGSSVNRFIIEGMARAGMGEPFVVLNENEAKEAAEKFQRYIQTPLLTKARVTYEGFSAYDVEPAAIPDLLAERPLIIFGKWKGDLTGRIVVTGNTDGRRYEKVIDIKEKLGVHNPALPFLWARHRIAILGDYQSVDHDEKLVKQITGLGLAYNLLTAYTSFVAVDTIVRHDGEKVETVRQPLPLPQGVSDLAVEERADKALASMQRSGNFFQALPASAPPPSPSRMKKEAAAQQVEVKTKAAPELGRSFTVDLAGITWSGSKPAADLLTSQSPWLPILQKMESCMSNLKFKGTGNIVLEITIDSKGKVTSATIVRDDLQLPELAKCLVGKAQSERFSATGLETTLRVPFVLAK